MTVHTPSDSVAPEDAPHDIYDEAEWRERLTAEIPGLRARAAILCRNAALADDLAQDCLVKAWRSRERFRAGTSLKAWLYVILRNTFYSHARKHREVEDVDDRRTLSMRQSGNQEQRTECGEVLEAVNRLSPSYREGIMLLVVEGLSYEEAAELCGVAVGTMKSRLHRARAALAASLAIDPLDYLEAQGQA